MLLLALHVGQTPLGAQEDDETSANREYRIKAAYLYQFGRYVEWPAKAFSSPKAPFVIGVLEQDPLIPDLEQIAEIKKIQDRPIQIRRFSSAAAIRPCHILYPPGIACRRKPKPRSSARRQGKAYSSWGIRRTSSTWGGTMQFVVEDNKIRVVISRKAAERAGFDHQRQVAPGRPCRRLA